MLFFFALSILGIALCVALHVLTFAGYAGDCQRRRHEHEAARSTYAAVMTASMLLDYGRSSPRLPI